MLGHISIWHRNLCFFLSPAMVNQCTGTQKAKKKKTTTRSKTSSSISDPSVNAIPKLKLKLGRKKAWASSSEPAPTASKPAVSGSESDRITPPAPIPPKELQCAVKAAVGHLFGPSRHGKADSELHNSLTPLEEVLGQLWMT